MIVDSSLSWSPHIEYVVKNTNTTLWLLIRFKSRGATQDQLLTLYQLKVRCITEFAAPAFHGALTVEQSNCLEMIQKKAFVIILGTRYKNYDNALKTLSQEKLHIRRLKLCETFALKCTKNPRHCDLFQVNPVTQTRQKQKYIEPRCITSRYYKSAVPFLTRLLNNVNVK